MHHQRTSPSPETYEYRDLTEESEKGHRGGYVAHLRPLCKGAFMKVKVLSIYDEPYKGSYRVPPAERVESTLQEWLKNNPNAKIEHVAQTPLADLDGRTYSLLVTIFYHD
jgi:hypothetical protein